ncbi:hypothetical protein AzCIB_1637 [Azoarcus sp. CIB]|uniref:hypothetical protein n=1 Tax=Aromatoleum sp. (strain CIB) TaxID=198107 RepID=UPI00067B832D|nr:hypothetical protein [Azoarcus sp. CIB]AKU11538.1 hypothetical protein AzCIB_1637 [Azoarcus sp. CIB]
MKRIALAALVAVLAGCSTYGTSNIATYRAADTAKPHTISADVDDDDLTIYVDGDDVADGDWNAAGTQVHGEWKTHRVAAQCAQRADSKAAGTCTVFIDGELAAELALQLR